jgi:hypothetical protein
MGSDNIGSLFVTVSLTAAITACVLHIIPSIITAARVGTKSSLLFIVIFPIYAFFSGFWYCLFLSTIVVFTYQFSSVELTSEVARNWGLGLGFFYIIIKAIIPWFIK